MASRRLGEILIGAGIVAPDAWEQLQRAEAAGQGSALLGVVRLGASSEQIARVISAAGAPLHAETRLTDIPLALLQRIPRPVALRYLALPVEYRENLLSVVLLDPFDPIALQNLSAVTGAQIQVGCADPIRLVRVLDRYHGTMMATDLEPEGDTLPLPPSPSPDRDPVPLTLRRFSADDDVEVLEPASGELAELFGGAAGPLRPQALPRRSTARPPSTPAPVPVLGVTSDDAPPAPVAVRAPPPPSSWSAAAPLTPGASTKPSDPEDEPESADPSPDTLARIALERPTPAAAADAPAERLIVPPSQPAPDLKEDFDFAVTRLRIAETRDEVGEGAILFLARCFPRAALFAVRDRTISGWLAGGELLPEQVEVIKLESGQPSLLWGVIDEGRPFIGSMPADRDTLSELLITPPRELAVFPVRIGERTVAILYGDTVDQRPILARRDLLERLADELGEALGQLILQSKSGV